MVSIFCGGGGGFLIGHTFVGFNSSIEKSVKKVEYPTFRDGCSILGELARATADISNGSNVNKTDISKESLKAFSAMDSMVESEMRKNIKKAEDEPNTVDSFDSGQNRKVEFNQKRKTLVFTSGLFIGLGLRIGFGFSIGFGARIGLGLEDSAGFLCRLVFEHGVYIGIL
jgi:hypothetical protein